MFVEVRHLREVNITHAHRGLHPSYTHTRNTRAHTCADMHATSAVQYFKCLCSKDTTCEEVLEIYCHLRIFQVEQIRKSLISADCWFAALVHSIDLFTKLNDKLLTTLTKLVSTHNLHENGTCRHATRFAAPLPHH